MEHQRPVAEGILVLMSIVTVVLPFCNGREFVVGGNDGWVPKPSECYNHWAERNRFQVNDTLYFKYKKGNDSVLVVSRNDYYTCNTANPIQSLTDGNSTFKFDHSGPFFFISGINNHCNDGQRLPIVVLAVRPPTEAPTATPTSPPRSPSASPGQPLPGEGPSGTKGSSTAPSTPSSSGSAAFSLGLGNVSVGVVFVMSIIRYVMGGLIQEIC